MPPQDLDKLAAVRADIATIDSSFAASTVAIENATRRLDELARTGEGAAELKKAERTIAALEREREELAVKRADRLIDIGAIRDDLVRVGNLEGRVADLAADAPVVLLPVRVETRFTSDRARLRVRVYPDTIHVTSHDPELTETEREAGEHYWSARWSASDSAPGRTAAWEGLVAGRPPTRAAFIAEALTPTNVGSLGSGSPKFPDVPLRPSAVRRPASVAAMPDRWVVLGYSGGREVLRKWGAPIPEELLVAPETDLEATATAASPDPIEPPAEQNDMPLGAMRWLVDYPEAERVGMAVTVDQADLDDHTLADGLDLLIAVGVDWTLRPDEGAQRLSVLLSEHRYAGGLSVLRQGTATNVTAEGRPDPQLAERAAAAAMDPAATARASDDSGGRRIGRALGLVDASTLERAPGALEREDLDAAHMQNALWQATWGYFFDQAMDPLVDDATSSAVRDHARRFVRGRGPLPALRIAEQPYGLLPVVAHAGWAPEAEGDIQHRIHAKLAALRVLWARGVDAAPRLGRSGRPDDELVAVLGTTARSASFRFRKVIGPLVEANTSGFDLAALVQGWIASIGLQSIGITDTPPFAAKATAEDKHRRLTIPIVQREPLSELDGLIANYIADVAGHVRMAGGFLRLLRAEIPRETLLHILLARAAELEVAKSAARIVGEFEVESGIREVARTKVTPIDHEIHEVEAVQEGPVKAISSLDEIRASTDVALKSVSAVSGGKTLANHIAGLTIKEMRAQPPTRELAAWLDSLDHLAGLPTAALERLVTETLDCSSHRLDAWFTSLATRRLGAMRGKNQAGAHIGAFGWVDDVRPGDPNESLGYVHAPSIPQAATAAVLRSGHLSHRAAAPEALAVDLSSDRVRLGLEIVDGVRRGQPVGALLGYRFERGLRERRLTLAQYILPFRRLAPLATSTDEREGNEPLEAIAARDVVDGVRLLARWKQDAGAFFTEAGVPASGNDRADITAELERLDALLDATGDLMLAESVHQAVLGNSERAGAALDALDRQADLPEVQFVRTPRAATGFNHRLLVLLGDRPAPAGWKSDPRAEAEPRLNAWVAQLLGPPGRIRFAAEVLAADGRVLQRLRTNLSELNLSPLAAVLAAGGGSREAASELEARLAVEFAGGVSASADAAELRLLDEPPPGSSANVIGLGELRTLARSIVDLVSSSRYAAASDLVAESERVPTGLDDAELKRRADAAVAGLRRAGRQLEQLTGSATFARVRTALFAAAGAGARGAVPAAADVEGLRAQAETVAAAIAKTIDALDKAESGFARSDDNPAHSVAHDLERLHAVFGDEFPALPRFGAPAANADELVASHTARSGLLGGDSLAPLAWLGRMALVRPAVERLDDVLTAVDALHGTLDPAELAVCQLPHTPDDRWLSLPLADGKLPRGSLSIAAYAPGGLDPTQPMAGLVVDQWTEALPAKSQTTGLSFQFDAPGSRAPQGVLIAVPPDPAMKTWTFDALVASVQEARELARLRPVDLQSVDAAGRFLPALWFPFNIEPEKPSIDFGMIENLNVEFLNAEFIARGGG